VAVVTVVKLPTLEERLGAVAGFNAVGAFGLYWLADARRFGAFAGFAV